MSTDTEHVEEDTETPFLETWREWYHVPVIGVVVLFMFLARIRSYDRFVTEDGTPALAAVDSWYHWRTIQWTAKNYPGTMPYDVWTGFPTGHYVGQFGTLFDQLIVTAAMIVGLGSPSTETLYTVALLSVPAMAALVAIPVFYMGRRLGGTVGGLVSIVVLALAPGTFFYRSMVGQLDHHTAEVLFMAIAMLAMMVALRVAEREKPIYELVVDGDWDALREPAIYSVLAGLALSLYIWVWPSAILLIGIFAVFFAVQLCLDYVRGVSPDHVAFVGAVSMGTTTVVTTLLIEDGGAGLNVSSFGYLQPLAALLVAAGVVFMAWLARQWNDRGLERRYYPVAIGGIIAAVLVVMMLALPNLYDTFVGNLTGRLLPLDPSTGALTVREAHPPGNFTAHVFDEFGAAFYTMLAGLGFLIARPFLGREYRAEYTLIVVWSLFLISMSMTQTRFAYYLVLAVAVVNAVFVADVVRLFDLSGTVQSLQDVETYQVIVFVLVIVLLFAPLLPPMAAAGSTAWDRGEQSQPSSDAMIWEDSNHWLAENTPEPGNYGGAGNESELEYYGTYDYPEDGDYDYPEGAYGVMSWWDYGHLITVQGERIPHANPFQQNARSASAYLTAESEERAELILEAIAAGEPVADRSTEELRDAVENADESHEQQRYVMIDYATAGGKFSAITAWSGPGYGHYVTPADYQSGESIPVEEIGERFGNLPYDNTTTSRLYFDDAAGMEHYRLVHENDAFTPTYISYAITRNGQVATNENGQPAVAINRRVTQQVQLELQQLQSNPNLDVQVFDQRQAAAVKTFERVEGATLTGSLDDQSVIDDENAAVYAQVELETGTNRTFVYTQQAELADDGSFEVTVPYATDDELGPDDGYTDSSVEAVGDYAVFVGTPDNGTIQQHYAGETAVPETAVVDGDTVDVTLEQTDEVVDDPDANETTDDGNETSEGDGDSAANETETNETDAGNVSSSLEPVAARTAR
ncbi:oligosaccharyl transferase, archaeosortase A system-associated [Natribaculum luteum]|uniref:dolichyl-phosphooligosaccharide-protein glycotransferase n=1 Tax=Natribaculum luteum TaxID=1586232 RepID=A0ABD5NV61_9EURY|nr:oligosaccharyl transferase, archaeosortase A system-associated [Natribaculum luteum]